jgi:hypothetical protein
MRAFLVLLTVLVFTVGSARADVRKCAVCGEAIQIEFVWVDGPSNDKRSVCIPCSKLETVCFVCLLPVKIDYKDLGDGRLICKDDLVTGLVSDTEAQYAFREVKRDVMQVLAGSGVLPDRNIKVSLADKRQIDRLYKSEGPGHAKTAMVMGLTESQLVKNDEFEHSVYIMDHLPPARFAAVCAHEYAHAWIHENVRKGRSLDGNSVEGFCEWVSYKVMCRRNEEDEKKMILANKYTRGQIDAFIKADENFRSYDVIKWIKEGADNKMDFANPSRVLTLDRTPAEPAGPLWAATAPPPAPTTLLLRGISGSANRRFALINDRTLQKNETGKVRIGETNVVVRCISISTNSVVIHVQGEEKPTVLYLNGGR